MGNSLGCSALGERLVSAARDGDLVEARMLLEFNPCLAKYSTFGGLNSPLHFAAAKGLNDIVTLLLENGADVNSRNYCGQTALMQACRHGHWKVVETLLIFKCNVTRADYFTGRAALHYAAISGHVRCIRLLVADFVPSAPYDVKGSVEESDELRDSIADSPSCVLAKFIDKSADGGVTALHLAALNGYSDCVQLLLDLRASVSAVSSDYGSAVNLIGAGSTPLHFAACGGNLKCCQILLARGASRLTLNCNGWLPLDVAKTWGHQSLEQLLSPNSDSVVPEFAPSKYLSLPLMSILNIARDTGLQSSAVTDDGDNCAVCLECACNVSAEGCAHQFCVKCALHLCLTSNVTSEMIPPGSIPCPLCRNGIVSFAKLQTAPAEDLNPDPALGFCNPCILHPCTLTHLATKSCRAELQRNRVPAVPSDVVCPLSRTPFPSVALPYRSCDDDSFSAVEPQGDLSEQSSRGSRSSATAELEDKLDKQILERQQTSCSGIFWGRRSSHREHQCNWEINA